MTGRGGRPRTFPLAIVPLALELREREGRAWAEVARTLKVHPGTLQARASEYRRALSYNTPRPGRSGPDGGSDTSEGGEA